MPTDLFFKINFSISFERQYSTVPNLLTCNTSLAVALHLIFNLISSVYGLREDFETLFVNDGYIYENESRLFTYASKEISTAIYGITTAFIIPSSIVAIIYRARRSTR